MVKNIWSKADKYHKTSYIDWCVELCRLNNSYGSPFPERTVTKRQIVDRYKLTNTELTALLYIGTYARNADKKRLPTCREALFQLCSVDNGCTIMHLCKPSTTADEVKAYKKEHNCIPAMPPGRDRAQIWNERKWQWEEWGPTKEEHLRFQRSREEYLANRPDTRATALAFFGLDPLSEELITLAIKMKLQKLHPDKGGNAEEFIRAQRLRQLLQP